ncbi:Ankyrin repeat domain-containing protein 7, partial [Trichinella papuae]
LFLKKNSGQNFQLYMNKNTNMPSSTRHSYIAEYNDMLNRNHIPNRYRGMRMALTLAVMYRQPDAARVLLQNGADPNDYCRDEYGVIQPPLLIACRRRDPQMAKILLEHGADVNKEDVFSRTALMIATEGRSRELVDLLLQWKAKLSDGSTDWKHCPLHFACKFAPRSGLAEVLLIHGCVPLVNDEDDRGKDALTYSLENHQLKLSVMLIKAGAKVKEKHLEIFNSLATLFRMEGMAQLTKRQKDYLMDSLKNVKAVKSLKSLATIAARKHILHSNNGQSITNEIKFSNIPETLKAILLLQD